MTHSVYRLFWFFIFLSSLIGPAHSIELRADTTLSKEGYFTLQWQGEISTENSVLQIAENADFNNARTLFNLSKYPHNSIAQSGYLNGNYFFRIAETGNGKTRSLSNIVKIEVQLHSFSLALLMFTAGFILFCILLWVILFGGPGNFKNQEQRG